MASTYSDRLKLELMETGANANTWGNNTNTNLETLDAFSGGYLSKSVAGSSNVTLTSNNADPTAEASNKVIELTGALTGDIHVFLPAVENNYLIYNNTSGSQSVTVAATGHGANGSVISQGGWHWVYCDGSANFNVTEAEFTTTNASALTEGTLADARLTANVTLNNASTISAGTLADARLTANVTLNNASTISAGTLSNDRLDTVPTTKGGTGLTTLGSAGEVLKVSSPGTALEFGTAGGGNYIRRQYTSPATWTKPTDLQSVKVTVLGGGGDGGSGGQSGQFTSQGGKGGAGGFAIEYISAPSIPGPVAVSSGGAGSTASFGGFLSATGGGNGPGAPGNPNIGPYGSNGSGSGGDITGPGDLYNISSPRVSSQGAPDARQDISTGTFGWGRSGLNGRPGQINDPGNYPPFPDRVGTNAINYQMGGGGGSGPGAPGGEGGPALVIVEEFY